MDAKERMEILAFSYLKSEKVFERIGKFGSMRGCMVWLFHLYGYTIEDLKTLPKETKKEICEEAYKYFKDDEKVIEYSKAIFILWILSNKL